MSDNIYNFRATEKKWIDFFYSYKLPNQKLKLCNSKKYYVLEMLPYPSGKIHMGHIRNYTIGDVLARYKRMCGFEVIHPMGWDSFGMPAENAAMKDGGHPKTWTENNIEDMKNQLKPFGFMYDWNREISTCSEEYYSKEQQIFLDLYKKGLAYRKESYVNWDPVDQTVLANEQVIDGKGWRSGAVVEKKKLKQWSIKITDYAEELLNGLKDLEGSWPEKVLKMQENWIGKSSGAIVKFDTITGYTIDVFTTRPDTLFGASFVAISADHELALKIAIDKKEIQDFINECKKSSTTEEAIEKAEKKGIFTGLYAKHPITKEQNLPVYIANFVLMDYGTGAVFGCPAHDERDYEFAKKYNLNITKVIETEESLPYTGDGKHINSQFLDGLYIDDAKESMIKYIEENDIGSRKVTYRLRDWLVSRQRYWGCPIPIIYCDSCGEIPSELPVLLPEDVKFNCKGNPLENHPTWKHCKCPRCGKDAIRDTDTLDTFFESSWYFLRYLDAHNELPINKEIADIAMPVDLCIGGIEHAVLHLLYARFFTLALKDMGYINANKPFKALLTQGMVCHKSYKNSNGDWVYPDEVTKNQDGTLSDNNGNIVSEYPSEKMSKSKKNTISPQSIIDSHGVDAVRLFMVSDTPPEKDFEWNTDALDGSWRFLNRIWKLFNKIKNLKDHDGQNDELIKITHKYIKQTTESLEQKTLNKSVALIRELFNAIESKFEKESVYSINFAFNAFVKLISPITPYICHEIYEQLGKDIKAQEDSWPIFDEKLAIDNSVTIAIQINGKLRRTFETEKDQEDDTIKNIALDKLGNTINHEQIKKIIVVKNRIVNIVM